MKYVNLSLLILLTALLTACTNPFFEDLLGVEEKTGATTYTVTFKLNDGTDKTHAVKTVTAPATTIGAANFPGSPTRSGYNFGGWNTASNGSGTVFTASTTVSGNITVYAKWNSYSYTVTFDNNGGDTEANPRTKTVASPATTIDSLPVPPSKTGYNFGGWNTAQNGSGTAFTALTMVSGSVTVYAQWTVGIITLNPDAGDGAFSETSFSISKTGATQTQTIAITGTDYTNPRWIVDGVLKSTEISITIDAADYGPGGGHRVSLLISKNGVIWSKDIAFTVTE